MTVSTGGKIRAYACCGTRGWGKTDSVLPKNGSQARKCTHAQHAGIPRLNGRPGWPDPSLSVPAPTCRCETSAVFSFLEEELNAADIATREKRDDPSLSVRTLCACSVTKAVVKYRHKFKNLFRGGHHMKFDDITKRLSGKQQLKEAKTNEDLDKPRTSDKVLLTDDQLGSVAGGVAGRAGKPGEMEKWYK